MRGSAKRTPKSKGWGRRNIWCRLRPHRARICTRIGAIGVVRYDGAGFRGPARRWVGFAVDCEIRAPPHQHTAAAPILLNPPLRTSTRCSHRNRSRLGDSRRNSIGIATTSHRRPRFGEARAKSGRPRHNNLVDSVHIRQNFIQLWPGSVEIGPSLVDVRTRSMSPPSVADFVPNSAELDPTKLTWNSPTISGDSAPI